MWIEYRKGSNALIFQNVCNQTQIFFKKIPFFFFLQHIEREREIPIQNFLNWRIRQYHWVTKLSINEYHNLIWHRSIICHSMMGIQSWVHMKWICAEERLIYNLPILRNNNNNNTIFLPISHLPEKNNNNGQHDFVC